MGRALLWLCVFYFLSINIPVVHYARRHGMIPTTWTRSRDFYFQTLSVGSAHINEKPQGPSNIRIFYVSIRRNNYLVKTCVQSWFNCGYGLAFYETTIHLVHAGLIFIVRRFLYDLVGARGFGIWDSN